MYNAMVEHLKTCEDAMKIAADGGRKNQAKVDQQQVQIDRRQTMMAKFAVGGNTTGGKEVFVKVSGFPETLIVFQKDSKTISLFNVANRSLVHKTVDFRGNFPHNF